MMIIQEFSLYLKCGLELEIQIGLSKVEQCALTVFWFVSCLFLFFLVDAVSNAAYLCEQVYCASPSVEISEVNGA